MHDMVELKVMNLMFGLKGSSCLCIPVDIIVGEVGGGRDPVDGCVEYILHVLAPGGFGVDLQLILRVYHAH